MKFIPIYWFSLASMCLGCSEVADVMFVIDGSENVSTVDFLHEVTFVASVPTQYNVSPNHVRFGAILYGSQVTSKISIVPNIENNQFVNEVTQLKQGGGQPLLFRALTELRKEFSKNFRDGSKQIAVVIISDKLHNKHAVLREVGYLRSAGVTVLPVGVGQGVQDSDLRDLLTFANPIHRKNSFSDIYRLSKEIYNSVCKGSQIHETTSLPQPDAHTRLQNTFVSVHSYKDGKQRFFIKKDGSSQTNEKGLQIEVPLLREMVEKQPAVRPYFISYSLLGSNDKNQYDYVSSTPNTNKKVSGIIINNEIWLQTSTPMIKTFPKEKQWTSKTTDTPLDDKTSLHWMAKGVKDFKDFLKKLGRDSLKNPDQSYRKDSDSNSLLTSNKLIDLKIEKTEKKTPHNKIGQQYAVKQKQSYAIPHNENSNDDIYRQTQSKNASRNIARSNTLDVKERTSPHSKTNNHQKKATTTISYNNHSFVKKDSNVIYTTENPSTNRNERKSLQNQINTSVESKLPKNVLTPNYLVYRNSILPEKDETTTARTDYKSTDHSKHSPNADRSVFTDNLLSGRRPIFTLSGNMDGNVFSMGNSLQSSSMKNDIKGGRLSQNGLSPNKIVHEKPQITSNLYSPSNEFYIENGVNSISYKEHFQRLMNPNSRPSETTKSPYSFDGSKLFSAMSSGSLYAPYRNNHQAADMMSPTSPVTTPSRRHKQPFYLTEQKYDQLIPSITESSTQPAMFDSEQLTTRNSQTFPPNFLALLGISLDNDVAPRARNVKSSPLVPALLQNNAEGYYHPETNVHFYRPAAVAESYLPSPWDEESNNYSQNLPLRPYRQNQRHVEFNFRDQNCTREIYPGDSRFYVESLMFRIEIRPCPPGTIFVSETCGCTKSFPVLEQFDCTPELHLTFDSDFSDMSGKSTVAINRVSLRNNSAIFNGDGELRVWRFSGGYIGNQLMLKMRFKPTHFHQRKQLLVGNCKKNTTMSYGAMIDTKSREVVMSITTSNGTADIKIHFKMFHWNDMVMIYDGSEFKAILNGQKKVVPLIGNVEERLSPLCIGRCDKADYGFQGSIDNMELLFCVPKVWGSL